MNNPNISFYCDSISICASKLIKQFGYKITSNHDQADIIWVRKNFKSFLPNLKKDQTINHIPNESSFTNKGKLTQNLQIHDHSQDSKDFKSDNFYQESYYFNIKNQKEYFLDFISLNKDDNNLWIIKPAGLSRGRGVKILHAEDIKHESTNNYLDNDFIVQKHINNPFLYHGKKMEFRVYWTFISIDPLVIAIYQDGIIRFCTEAFSLSDFTNPLKHITNQYQQDKFRKTKDNIKLKTSFNDFLKTIENINHFELKNIIFDKINQMISYVAQASIVQIKNSETYLNYKDKVRFFGFYGCDIMLDSKLQPWLLEVQKGPGLSFSDPDKHNVIAPALSGGLNLFINNKNNNNYKNNIDNFFIAEF